jgi:hypothetical protein
MAIRILDFIERYEVAMVEFHAPPGRNSIEIVLTIDPPPSQVGFRFVIEQSLDGVEWWTLAGGTLRDVRRLDAQGQPVTSFSWMISEQLLRSDECDKRGYVSMRDHEFRGQTYRQLALCDRQRLTVETTGPLTYSVDATVADSPLPHELRRQLGGE